MVVMLPRLVTELNWKLQGSGIDVCAVGNGNGFPLGALDSVASLFCNSRNTPVSVEMHEAFCVFKGYNMKAYKRIFELFCLSSLPFQKLPFFGRFFLFLFFLCYIFIAQQVEQFKRTQLLDVDKYV